MEDMKGNVLITGGAGFIGCNLVESLLCNSSIKKIFILDNLSSGNLQFLPNDPRVEFIFCDIENYEKLKRLVPNDVDYIFHLAAHFANQNSVDNPLSDINTNIIGTLNVLKISLKIKVKKIINASSSCVYGNEKNMSEDCYLYPYETPYAINKLTSEIYFKYFSHLYNLPCLSLRIFNTFGKYELAHKYRNVIPNFIDLALKNKPLTITGDGQETRDFTFVSDTVDLMIKMASSSLSDGSAFNSGTGYPTTIKYLAETIINKSNSNSIIKFEPRRDWDEVTNRLSVISKSQSVFDYEPKISIHDGIEKTVEWYIKNLT